MRVNEVHGGMIDKELVHCNDGFKNYLHNYRHLGYRA